MKITIIGVGNVGSAFAIELKKSGNDIISLIDNSISKAGKIGKIIGCRKISKKIDTLSVSEPDMVLICVKDSEIRNVADEFRNIKLRSNTIIAHTSGAISSKILKSAGIKSSNAASFHPIQTLPFVSLKNNKLLTGIYFGIEGGDFALGRLKQLIHKLKSKYIIIPASKKTEYHLSCVLASNFVIANFYLSSELSKSLGITEKKLFESQKPLLLKTIDNINKYGVVKSVTGPVSRGDLVTVKNHMDLLHSKYPNFVEYYKRVSEILFDVSKKKNKNIKNINKIFDR